MMTSKERVHAAVEFSGPDKIPFIPCYLPASLKHYEGLAALLEKYPSDIAGDGNLGLDNPLYKKGQWIDEWHCEWTVLRDGILGQVTGHPLADDKALDSYIWPNAMDLDISEDIIATQYAAEKYVRVGWVTFFERMVDLRGFEQAMIDIGSESTVFMEIKEKIFQYNMTLIDRLTALDADCVAFADDWGSQLNMMINPKAWEKHFLPAYKEQFSKVKNAGMHVYFHTDGYTMPILPMLADAGVDIFWADMTVNPPEELASLLGGKVCFQALTDVQFAMVNSSPDEVRAYAKRLMKLFGDFKGGLIGCSEVDPDQPWENVVAMYETLNECGAYPLQK